MTEPLRLSALADRLSGGDHRSIGAADRVAHEAASHPGMLAALVRLMSHADPLVAMRAADTTEKAMRSEHAALAAHRDELLNLVARTTQHEVRWHLAQLLPSLELSECQSREVVRLLETYLTDPRRVVRVNALHAVADIAAMHPALAGGPGNSSNTT